MSGNRGLARLFTAAIVVAGVAAAAPAASAQGARPGSHPDVHERRRANLQGEVRGLSPTGQHRTDVAHDL